MGVYILSILIVDCLGAGAAGKRFATLDVIGVGPRLVAGILESLGYEVDLATCDVVLKDPSRLRDHEILMVSGMSSDIESMAKVAKAWGRNHTVAGGPSAVDYAELL
ncbi:MAG: B12-binding domain-containing radical SAM protein, partial [Thermoprotei archaeon]